MSTTIDYKNLIGRQVGYFGMDGNCFKLDAIIYEAIEDESDGYRSMCDHVETRTCHTESLVFARRRLATVMVRDSESCDGIDLVDVEDGHVWASIGTDNSDDYYPQFTCTHYPKPPPVGLERDLARVKRRHEDEVRVLADALTEISRNRRTHAGPCIPSGQDACCLAQAAIDRSATLH